MARFYSKLLGFSFVALFVILTITSYGMVKIGAAQPTTSKVIIFRDDDVMAW
jgi:hypothetical protein